MVLTACLCRSCPPIPLHRIPRSIAWMGFSAPTGLPTWRKRSDLIVVTNKSGGVAEREFSPLVNALREHGAIVSAATLELRPPPPPPVRSPPRPTCGPSVAGGAEAAAGGLAPLRASPPASRSALGDGERRGRGILEHPLQQFAEPRLERRRWRLGERPTAHDVAHRYDARDQRPDGGDAVHRHLWRAPDLGD